MASAERTEYLWAAHAAVGRGLDNLRVAKQAVESALNDLQRAEIYEFPEGCAPADLAERVASVDEGLSELLATGMQRSAAFHQVLMDQEHP